MGCHTVVLFQSGLRNEQYHGHCALVPNEVSSICEIIIRKIGVKWGYSPEEKGQQNTRCEPIRGGILENWGPNGAVMPVAEYMSRVGL